MNHWDARPSIDFIFEYIEYTTRIAFVYRENDDEPEDFSVFVPPIQILRCSEFSRATARRTPYILELQIFKVVSQL